MFDKDPRPDLVSDHELWERVLGLSSQDAQDANDPNGLHGALLGFRCCGAELVYTPDGSLALRPGEMGESYAEDRQKWLSPHKENLIQLLQRASKTAATSAIAV